MNKPEDKRVVNNFDAEKALRILVELLAEQEGAVVEYTIEKIR